MHSQIRRAKRRFICNLISRKALAFFIGVLGTVLLIIYGLFAQIDFNAIAILVGAWTASISALASIWCIGNHFDRPS